MVKVITQIMLVFLMGGGIVLSTLAGIVFLENLRK